MNNEQAVKKLQKLAKEGFKDWESLGNIRATYGHCDKLVLLSYTKGIGRPADFTPIENVCRGFILEMGTGRIIARPFDKFWNWGDLPEEGAKALASGVYQVQEKMDGSLGIVYHYNDRWHCATRGSFTSDQAQWGSDRVCDDTIEEHMVPGCTYLFELIYDENRVVVDYGGEELMVLLAIRDNKSGEYMPKGNVTSVADAMDRVYRTSWRQPDVSSVDEILALLPTLPGHESEGFVVTFNDGSRWKFKGDDYRAMHRLATGYHINAVREEFFAGSSRKTTDVVLDHRLREYTQDVSALSDRLVTLLKIVEHAQLMTKGMSRKDKALWLQEHAPKALSTFFAMEDGKPFMQAVRKSIA